MGALVSEALMHIGVKLYRNETFQGVEISDGSVRAVVTDKRTIPADIVILGLGVRPNTELAGRAGIALGVREAIKVNDRMQTNMPDVWAAGDCVESFHLVSRRPVHIALGTVANKQGRVAGINLGGGYATFPGVLGTAVSKICDVEVARTGLQEREIHALGLEYVVGRIESMTRASYYPHSGQITVKALAEKGSGRLLGGQIVGVEGAAKRIDIFATALHAGFSVENMINLDLSYAPPYSGVWDPVHIAARRATAALAGRS
jgi:NADPH-dependent 2,4-dienoyl-CoA reductase/sulfur reductase-like enzyme